MTLTLNHRAPSNILPVVYPLIHPTHFLNYPNSHNQCPYKPQPCFKILRKWILRTQPQQQVPSQMEPTQPTRQFLMPVSPMHPQHHLSTVPTPTACISSTLQLLISAIYNTKFFFCSKTNNNETHKCRHFSNRCLPYNNRQMNTSEAVNVIFHS